MKHFLEISQLSPETIENCIQRALYFKANKIFPSYPQHTLAHLFYENSTRTRVSFEMAAHHLSMPVIHLDLQHSSESKGEVMEDTLQTLAAMGVTHFVIRHKENGIQQALAEKCNDRMHIINAGDGTHAHPSQAMLDMVTIIEEKKDVSKLKIAIVGNIRHSRVANSLQCISKALNVGELVLIAPEIWQPETLHYGRVCNNLKEGLTDADVIICLRVQKERLNEHEHLDLKSYQQDFMINEDRLSDAKPNAMVMHPGPINRGVEISSEVADGQQSFILRQVENGVFTRMAILEALISP